MAASRRGRIGIGIATAALALGGLVGPAVAGAAKSGPHLVVTPVSGLTNGKSVRVSGTGFTPGDTVYVVECLVTAKDSSGCNIVMPPDSQTITSAGVLPTSTFKVTTGKVGTGYCGTKKSNLKSCDISVGTATGADSAVARIQFKLPKG